jgi:hypothetical protein
MLRVGQVLLLGEKSGYLEVFDIKTSSITSYYKFAEVDFIYDIKPIDEANYLLATDNGILKTTNNQMIKHYYLGADVLTLCLISDSFYLVGFVNNKLIVWNEQTD